MGKLKDLESVKSAKASSFAYFPPDTAFDAMRILVKPALVGSATVSLTVLDAVLRGLRRASPLGRIVIVEGVTGDTYANTLFDDLGVTQLLDREMRVTHTDNLIRHTYPNLLPNPYNFASIEAPEYIKDYNCVVTVGALNREHPELFGGIANLRGIVCDAPQDKINISESLIDVYFTIGQHFDGAVVEVDEQVVWGDDLLAVDEVAYQMAEIPVPEYLMTIRQLRKEFGE